ncbi:unnamed protein product [marine sediment metagenome]|uniref:Uncharacterized protein n=1 Tax=marine sediment metagenome TaxID=412755 RepID=X0Z616_9ZZZZ
MIRMTLCPNCETIQKAGTTCTICKCPITSTPVSYPEHIEEDYELQSRRHLAYLDMIYGPGKKEEEQDDKP